MPACDAREVLLDKPYALAVEQAETALRTSARTGLASDGIDRLRGQCGLNELISAAGPSWWKRFGQQFKDLVIWILIGAALFSAATGNSLDAAVILAIVVLNGLIGFAQEEHAGRLLRTLKQLSAPHAAVIRDGALRSIPTRELVPGDLIKLEPGSRAPADARLVLTRGLKMDEAALTGESSPVDKESDIRLDEATPLADRVNMVHMGTLTNAGWGLALVTSIGMHTELGQIAGMLPQQIQEPTPLERRLTQLGKVLALLILVIIAVIFVLQIIRGGSILQTLILAVSLGVAAVPEGLPAVVTISLALGLQRMAKRHALIRRLPSVETLGCVTVICSDKTGTLTRNEMTVREVLAGDRRYHVTGTGYDARGEFFDGDSAVRTAPADLVCALRAASWCNHAQISRSLGDRWGIAGDPTEAALLIAAAKAAVERPGSEPVYEIPFESDRKSMSMVYGVDSIDVMYAKGAPEAILQRCAYELITGNTIALTPQRRQEILRIASEMASRALRVLGLAYREFPSDQARSGFVENDLTFVGLAGMIDPPREEAKAAVAKCRAAGVRPIMITGDHPNTAAAIAGELGIASPSQLVMTGAGLDALSDAELTAKITDISVYARVTAAHKLRIVRAWKSKGQIVAMTGDGINDAPAVKAADIGIAMGMTGTDVTKEAADMVLTDDNFSSILNAVEEGRGIFDNIQKVVQYLLASNTSEILFMLVAALVGWPVPLLAIQILWINLITDSLPALALGAEPTENDVMNRPPRPVSAAVIDRRRGVMILIHGCLMTLAVLAGFWFIYGNIPSQLPAARTTAFCILVFSQIFYSVACRSTRHVMPQLGFYTNGKLAAAICVSVLIQVAAVVSPFGQKLLATTTLSAFQWAVVLTMSLFTVTIVELGKLMLKHK